MGGEYNFGNLIWNNVGAIYDPQANVWTSLKEPAGWGGIGDMPCATMPNGQVLFLNPLSSQVASFNPATNTFTALPSSPVYDNESALTMLPNGNMLHVYTWTDDISEIFNTTTETWENLPNMPYSVVSGAEIGPAVLMYNGQVIQFGANGSNILFNSSTNTWSAAPSFPTVTDGQIACADAPGTLLPNGQVLVDASPPDGGCYFYLFNGTTLTQVAGPPDSANSIAFVGNFCQLPNGQILFTDQSSNVELYTPGGSPNPAWAPTITQVASTLKLGESYTLSGTQLNGLSGATGYGDDEQNEANFPTIKIKMAATGHVFYAREYSPSTMAICTGSKIVSTHFTIPLNMELGAATIEAVTNGIPSAPVAVNILPSLEAYAVSLYPGQGVNPNGTVSDVNIVDGKVFSGQSVSSSLGQICAVEADFLAGKGITTVKAFSTAKAAVGVTEQLFIYNWVSKTFVQVSNGAFGSGMTTLQGAPTTNGAQYVSSTGEVRVIVRGVEPAHVSANTFKMSVDYIGLQFG